MQQTTFASAAYDHKKVTTKPKKILAVDGQISSMATVVRVNRTALSKEREWPGPPMNMQTMLRMYFLQQWYNLSNPGVEEALYDMESMRRFAHIELIDYAIPAETTILNLPAGS